MFICMYVYIMHQYLSILTYVTYYCKMLVVKETGMKVGKSSVHGTCVLSAQFFCKPKSVINLFLKRKEKKRGLPDCSVVKNPSANAEHGSSPWFRKIPHAMEQLGLCLCSPHTEPMLWGPGANSWAHGPQLLKPEHPRAHAPQEKPLRWEAENHN